LKFLRKKYINGLLVLVALTTISAIVFLHPFSLWAGSNAQNNVQAAATSMLVSLKNGKLSYGTYANEGESNEVNTIPDFSNSGYMGGGVKLPNVPVKKALSPVSGDNHDQIQNAINEVSKLPADQNGIRGAVLLKAGTYEVNSELKINTSGVVLRGEGQGPKGTILQDQIKKQNNFLNVEGSASKPWEEISNTRQSITTDYIPTGTKSFELASTADYKIGDKIIVLRTPNDAWINALDMAQYGWTANSYAVGYERLITNISDKQITIDAPIVQAIEKKYGGGAIYTYKTPGRISQVGVENLRIESFYASDTDENHGWIAVYLNQVENGWVSGVTTRYFGYGAVSLNSSVSQVTVQESAYLDGKSQVTGERRYSFNIGSTSSHNLFQRDYASSGRHDFVTGARTPGPNVFVDSLSEDASNDTGPHHRYATGILFDNIETALIRVQNRGAMGTGHGWAGAQTLFWNSTATKEMRVDSPPGARNWAIGSTTARQTGQGFWESVNAPVTPRSLYYQQLQDRLGPASVQNVTISEQRQGSITALLQTWAGNGPLSDYTWLPPTQEPEQNDTQNMKVTFYGWSDNIPTGTTIAYPKVDTIEQPETVTTPQATGTPEDPENGEANDTPDDISNSNSTGTLVGLHKEAGGSGTYEDPMTLAGAPSEWPVGTRFYVPYLQKYFVMEDYCETCVKEWDNGKAYHIHLWLGGDSSSDTQQLTACETSLTRVSTEVEINPPAGKEVSTTPLFDAKTGTCYSKS
jgi:hypothetical protein